MCGICGVIDLNGRGIDEKALIDMREALVHRGPDDAGLYVDEYAGLGHRRLSIIDLSEAGRQPLQNEDGTVLVICNGEIYNYRELRQKLLDSGHHFRSNSDNEVLVHAYEQWGLEKTLVQIKGMFAFVLWDKNAKTLWLARDRLGVKPLFYAEHQGRLLFSSEVRALYGLVAVTPESVDRGALDFYLAFGYVPPDRCLVRGIQKLPPAHVLRYDRDGIKCWRYWDVGFVDGGASSFSDELEQVDQLLTRAVARRLESDVPLGSFLSAGVDSGLVTAIAASSLDTPLRTFTVGFKGASPGDDERSLARQVAQRYGTRHEELIVEPADKSLLPTVVWNGGEPFFDVGILPFYQISRAARSEIIVALTGDGGDESFCGYYNVYAAYMASKLRRWVPGTLRRSLARLLDSVNGHNSMPSMVRRFGTLLRYANQRPIELYDDPDWWHSGIRTALYDPAWVNGQIEQGATSVVAHSLEAAKDLDEIEQILYTDLNLRLPGDYLTKSDIASNAVALEVRSPFLDHELVELAAGLPSSSKMFRWRQKGLLRELARRYLPPESIARHQTGFGPPLRQWLREEWAPTVRDLVGKASRKGRDCSTGRWYGGPLMNISPGDVTTRRGYGRWSVSSYGGGCS